MCLPPPGAARPLQGADGDPRGAGEAGDPAGVGGGGAFWGVVGVAFGHLTGAGVPFFQQPAEETSKEAKKESGSSSGSRSEEFGGATAGLGGTQRGQDSG